MEIKKILWPTDLSENASQALPYVISLTQKYQAQLYLLYVTEDLSDHDRWWGEFDTSHVTKLRDREMRGAEKRLEEVCQKELADCPYYQKRVVLGDPAQEILKAIEEEDIDLVVMATHGLKGGFPFGSVTEKVVKNSPVPVFTVNPLKRKK